EFSIDYGANLQSEHERWLTEKHFKCPVTVYDFPKEIKPFYMRSNDDGKTVAAIDLLVPGIGEIVGGSQREERLELLEDNMRRHNMDPADYKLCLDLRRYGTVPHSGFGLGFERMLMFITGISNIRDVIPFARTPGSAEFLFAGYALIDAAGCRTISADGLTVILISSDDLFFFLFRQSSSSK